MNSMIYKRTFPAACVILFLTTFFCGCSTTPDWKTDRLFADKCLNQGLWKEAVMRYQRVLDHNPGNIAVLNNLGIAYEALGEFEKARKTYEKALSIDPKNKKIKKNLDALLSIKHFSSDIEEDEQYDE